MSEISAYEKMLKDGSAFKKIDMQKITNQMYAQAEGGSGGGNMPLGDPVKEVTNEEEEHIDWTAVDEGMQRRMNALREKIDNKKDGNTSTKNSFNESQEIKKLKARVKRLEEALMVVMETQEKLLG